LKQEKSFLLLWPLEILDFECHFRRGPHTIFNIQTARSDSENITLFCKLRQQITEDFLIEKNASEVKNSVLAFHVFQKLLSRYFFLKPILLILCAEMINTFFFSVLVKRIQTLH